MGQRSIVGLGSPWLLWDTLFWNERGRFSESIHFQRKKFIFEKLWVGQSTIVPYCFITDVFLGVWSWWPSGCCQYQQRAYSSSCWWHERRFDLFNNNYLFWWKHRKLSFNLFMNLVMKIFACSADGIEPVLCFRGGRKRNLLYSPSHVDWNKNKGMFCCVTMLQT